MANADANLHLSCATSGDTIGIEKDESVPDMVTGCLEKTER